MVYIDVRDRKFLLITIVPTVLALLLMVLAEQDDPLFFAIFVGGTFALFFVLYVVATLILERVQSSDSE